MTLHETINISRRKRLVEDDKFDKHMRKARVQDIDSRKAIFCQQTENTINESEKRASITPSFY
jgi:hypothetical protein